MSDLGAVDRASNVAETAARRDEVLRAILDQSRAPAPLRLFVYFGALALGSFGALKLDSRPVSEIALLVGAYSGPVLALELWVLRRRFEKLVRALAESRRGF